METLKKIVEHTESHIKISYFFTDEDDVIAHNVMLFDFSTILGATGYGVTIHSSWNKPYYSYLNKTIIPNCEEYADRIFHNQLEENQLTKADHEYLFGIWKGVPTEIELYYTGGPDSPMYAMVDSNIVRLGKLDKTWSNETIIRRVIKELKEQK